MRFPDELLMAYADGELQGEQRAEVQQAIARDPEIARRVAEHTALRGSLEAAFAAVLKEPVPAHLLEAALDRPAPRSAKILPLRPKGPVQSSVARWAALAACFLLGIGFWQLIRPNSGPMVTERNGGLVPTGALARALSNQLAHEQTAQSRVQIGISFHSKSGHYCRTFQIQRGSYAGMACRTGGRWQVQMLGQIENAERNAAGYRQASSAVPPWLAQQVNDIIAGEPLDAHGEADARARGWH